MPKVVLVTGSTDGIGLATAKSLIGLGHTVLVHGRNAAKVADVHRELSHIEAGGRVGRFVADLSRFSEAAVLARAVANDHPTLDVLINNAGVFGATDPITADGLDVRFTVNTIAPYLLTKQLLPQLGATGRVINVSSAAQSSVDPNAMAGRARLTEGVAYAQSKLALIMWSRHMASKLNGDGPAIISINPGSLLATKMVKDAYGVPGSDIRIGADILTRAALSDEFATASGQYFDNDQRQFGAPHRDALDARKCDEIVRLMDKILENDESALNT